MTNVGLGFNIDGLFLDQSDKDWLENELKNNNPKAVVVLNDINYAIRLKNSLPKTKVIFRTFWGDEHDNIHRTTSVDQFLEIYSDALKNNLIGYSNNEPKLDDSLIEWEYELSRKILERNKKVVQFNWSVGLPETFYTDFNKWKKNLDIIASNKNNLYLGLHEYWFGWPFAEFNVSPIVDEMRKFNLPRETNPYIIGRHRWILEYCRTFLKKTPSIIITEFGWDEVDALLYKVNEIPGYERPLRIPTVFPALETWAFQSGMGMYEYAFEQFKLVWEKVYKNIPEIEGACFFPFGGTGVWNDASIHRHRPLVRKLISDYNFDTIKVNTGDEYMITNGALSRKLYTGIDINFRIKPSTSGNVPLFALTAGTEVLVFTNNNVSSGEHVWTPMIAIRNGLWTFGWIASNLSGVKFSDLPEEYDMPRIRELVTELNAKINYE